MDSVKVTDEKRLFPSYGAPDAEELPMFAENRVHQRSSGNPYPNRVVMQVKRGEKTETPYRVITLENEYLRIELLPELGGRIYSAFDKRTGYDFFYKQHVIKPALIGMLGSWISGGCEFNWPCHHRPSTFMPVDVHIQREAGGAVTVWMSENEPLDRMRGTVGVRLAPGEARFDTQMKVYNRTPRRHSFLWWENAAVPVNPQYRLVFPPDVHYVQFHYRKNVTSYPVASGVYNGISLGNGTDISYHKNTRQPTSYFCAPTAYDFFGGYDEGKMCGVIHTADHTVSVGKKMFTWAYNQLSRSWEKALTDTDGAYAELMASSYSLNQPDFTWLMPYEKKEFSQMWYPVGAIGLPLCASRDAAVSVHDGQVFCQVTVPLKDASLEINGRPCPFSTDPNAIVSFPAPERVDSLILRSKQGRTLLRYTRPDEKAPEEMPAPIPDNPTLDTLRTAREAYLMGVHAEQYRDPAIRPDGYWREALRRDPRYAPALMRLAEYELAHLRPREAWDLAQRAWKAETVRNDHPESGELPYLMGRILEEMGNETEALAWYMQAAWAQDARSRALTRAAMIRGRRQEWEAMDELAQKALQEHAGNETAAALGRIAALHLSPETAQKPEPDPLDFVARALAEGASEGLYTAMGADPCQTVLDMAEDLSQAGESALAADILAHVPSPCAQTEYVRAFLLQDASILQNASSLEQGIAFPSRGIECRALRWAVQIQPADAKALYLLGCQMYALENYSEGARLWEMAIKADPRDYRPRRCLAVAYDSHLNRKHEALALLDQALALHPHDGQLIWEKALVMTRLGVDPARIAAFLEEENCPREDLIIELCRAWNRMGEWEKALNLLEKTDFTPCEGGEHAVAEQYMFAHHALGRQALDAGQEEEALTHFTLAQHLPDHLGAGLWNEVLLVPHRYFEGLCLQKLGRQEEAAACFRFVLSFRQDYFTDMHLPSLPCWQAMAYLAQGLGAPAQELIAAHLRRQEAAAQAIDAGYYRTTPFFISYMDDPKQMRQAACLWQTAMAHYAAGDEKKAAENARQALELDPTRLPATLLANA